jgi:anthranilate phosphoribosyltransferase
LAGPGRKPLVETLQALDIVPSTTRQHAETALARRNFAYLPLESLSPDLSDLLALRGVLGLRSPLNTVGRLLDPADARGAIDGVFHPAYIDLHLGAATLLGRRVSVIKGGGGEAEWSGAKPVTVHTTGAEKTWLSLPGAGKPESQTVPDLLAVWAGSKTDPAAEAAITGTAAIALRATSPELQPEACLQRVQEFWQKATP